jgi:thiol-disulfide isomerase/thioredoxin
LREAIHEVLNKAIIYGKPEQVTVIAKNLQTALGRHQPGWTTAPFALPEARRDTLYSEELKGQFVYLYFYASWSTTAKKEIQLLKKMHEQYKDVVTIVCINMDDSFNTFIEDMSNYRDCDWTFVFGSADPLLRDKFKVRTIPHACLLDTEGRYMHNYTRTPSEGVDGLFQPLMAKLKKQQPGQGQKSWKD